MLAFCDRRTCSVSLSPPQAALDSAAPSRGAFQNDRCLGSLPCKGRCRRRRRRGAEPCGITCHCEMAASLPADHSDLRERVISHKRRPPPAPFKPSRTAYLYKKTKYKQIIPIGGPDSCSDFEVTGMSCASVQRPCGKGRGRGAGRQRGVGQPADQQHAGGVSPPLPPPTPSAGRWPTPGYGASPAADTPEAGEAALEDTETPRLKRRLIASLCFLVPLMYVTMGHMAGLPLPPFLEGQRRGRAVVRPGAAGADPAGLLESTAHSLISGFKGVIKPRPRHGHAGGAGRSARRWPTACLRFS